MLLVLGAFFICIDMFGIQFVSYAANYKMKL